MKDQGKHREYFKDNPKKEKEAKEVELSLSQPMSLLTPTGVALAGLVATTQIPSMLGITTAGISRLGVKAGVGFGGGFLVSKFLGKTNGAMWAIGSAVDLLIDILNTYLFTTSPLTFSGMRAFPVSAPGRRVYKPNLSGEFGNVGDIGEPFEGPWGEMGAFPLSRAGEYAI